MTDACVLPVICKRKTVGSLFKCATSTGFYDLASNHHVTDICVCMLHDADTTALFNILGTHPSVRHIAWKKGRISSNIMGAFLAMINANPNLISLDVDYIDWKSNTYRQLFAGLHRNATLQKLKMKANRSVGRGSNMAALSAMLRDNIGLTYLDLSFCDIPHSGLERLCDALADNATLQTLNLSFNDFREQRSMDVLVNMLERNTALTDLNISSSFVHDFAKLWTWLKHDRRLRTLTWESYQCTNYKESVRCMVDTLCVNTTLTSLKMGNSYNSGDWPADLMGALDENQTLTEVDISGWKLFYIDHTHRLGKVVTLNTGLISLNVGNCDMSTRDAIALFESLTHNTTLSTLSVYGNKVVSDYAPMKSLASALSKNNSLTKVDVRNCGMKARAYATLCRAMHANSSVVTLRMGAFYNKFDESSMASIATMLRMNTTLTNLHTNFGMVDHLAQITQHLVHNFSLIQILNGRKYHDILNENRQLWAWARRDVYLPHGERVYGIQLKTFRSFRFILESGLLSMGDVFNVWPLETSPLSNVCQYLYGDAGIRPQFYRALERVVADHLSTPQNEA